MNNFLLQYAIKMNKDSRHRRHWQKIVECLIVMVVFCTTYALILPAITMTKETICGIEAHEHSDVCYADRILYDLNCCLEGQDTEGIFHKHQMECYDTDGELRCPLTELSAYDPETHVHDENCFRIVYNSDRGRLSTDSDCATPSNVSTDSDVREIKILECPFEHAVYHEHRDACLTDTGVRERILICKEELHTHVESCYPKTRVITPTNAWEMTGEWPKDLLMVAESQLNYGESEENTIYYEGEYKGYTVYGDAYGDPFADWNILFANYCLEKIEITEFPINQDPESWVEELKEAKFYRGADYLPKPGDLMFLDGDLEPEAEEEGAEIIPVVDMVGIVSERIPATEDSAEMIRIIAGDLDAVVDYADFEITDPKIIGFAEMPLKEPEKPVIRQMNYQGNDYVVTVTFGPEAEIPETAELSVREIEQGSEEYDYYYQQSLSALTDGRPEFYEAEEDGAEEELIDPVCFARFFDISFLIDGNKIEPSSSVEIQIKYKEAIEVPEQNEAAAVHFSEDGIEILDTEMDQNPNKLVDGFTFTQESFSVTGTVVMSLARIAPVEGTYAATFVPISQVDKTGRTSYVMYTEYNGKYYAIASRNDKFGYAMEVYVNKDGVVGWDNSGNEMLWKFNNNGNYANSYFIQNLSSNRYLHAFYNSDSDYGTTTTGRYSSVVNIQNDGGFKAIGNNYYAVITDRNGELIFSSVSAVENASVFYLAKYEQHHVWLDGTLGGLMSYTNAPNKYFASGSVFTLPETWGDEDNDENAAPMKYDYTLRGWYDIDSDTYYPVDLTDGVDGITVSITQDTVFYADWVPTTYSIGENNEHVVQTLDTSEFVTIDLFDYNMLFNIMSASHTGSISSGSHSESWSETSGKFDRYWGTGNGKINNFYFRDWDSSGELSYPTGGKPPNDSWSKLVEDILKDDNEVLLDILFDPDQEVLGKNYVGSANYLFQYMNDPSDKYYGYYYYDSERNAASYYKDERNPSNSRFYVYDYLERTSVSESSDGADFVPFNSPYANNNGYTVNVDSSTGMYVYHGRGEENMPTTNFNFGMVTNVHFYLPNDVGHTDEYGNPGNLDTSGKEMVFRFDGDDDVWVFVDGKLVLDIGGIHGVESGTINFSTGEVINSAGQKESIKAVRDANGTLTKGISEGGHDLTIYYLERGSSLSNCCIYFNLAPRYAFELQKKDYHTRENLEGVAFDAFSSCPTCASGHCVIGSDGHCTLSDCNCRLLGGLSEPVVPAKLWNTHDEAKADPNDENTTNHFVAGENGLHMFGLVAGKTYYIMESAPLDGYPPSDDLIRITLNDHGTEVSEVTILNGADQKRTQGYEIVTHTLDETKRLLYMVLTNQKEVPEGETTKQVRVTKNWILDEENPALIPESITVHLTKDGKIYGHPMVLSAKNGWTYTWTGLPSDGSVYDVIEDQVPGFTLLTPFMLMAMDDEQEYEINWLNVAVLEDGVTFLLKTDKGYLAQQNGSLTVVSIPTDDEGNLVPPDSAKWEVSAFEEGFKIGIGGYYLTLDGGRYKILTSGNQELFYDGTGIFAMSGGQRYYIGSISNGTATANTSTTSVELIKEEKISIDVFEVSLLNYQLNEEEMTFVEVNKVWANTSEAIWEKSVTIHLLADGVDTGQKLVLNQSNGWKGRFEGLSRDKSYTVYEDAVPKYSTEYSEVEEIPASTVITLEETNSFGEYGIYCFANGNNAVASYSQNGSLNLGGTTFDKSNPHDNQQWEYINGKLKNIDSQQYLVLKKSNFNNYQLSQTSKESEASNVSLESGRLRIWYNNNTSRYLTLSGISVGNSASGTTLTVYQSVTKKIPTNYKVTVTNTYGAYILPETGGIGTCQFTFGGLLLIAVSVLMYIRKRGNRWRKEECG